MNKKKLRLAFIGGGINSAIGTTHFIAAQLDSKFEVVAGCFSRDQRINIETGQKWHINPHRCYKNIKSLLENEKGLVDAIVVLTPTPSHKDHIISSINYGYPVISEKSLSSSLFENLTIKKKLIEKNGFLAITFNYIGYPIIQELRELIKKNKFGKLQQIHIEMPQETFLKKNASNKIIIPQAWRLKDKGVAMISLDLGVHIFQLIDFLTEEKIKSLVSHTKNYGHFKKIVDNVICIVNYSNNLTCNIWFSKVSLGSSNGLKIRVYGDKGSASWLQMNPEHLELFDNKGGKYILDRANQNSYVLGKEKFNRFKAGHPSGYLEAFANIYSDLSIKLNQFMLKKKMEISDIDASINNIKILEAINKSSKNKKWIYLNK